MLKQSEIASAGAPAGAKWTSKKPPLGVGDLPTECRTVLNSKPGAPVIAEDGTVPAALKLEASKDAGPPLPHLDPEALAALKAQVSGKKGAKPGAKATAAAPATPSAKTPAATPAPAASAANPPSAAPSALAPASAAEPPADGSADDNPSDDPGAAPQ